MVARQNDVTHFCNTYVVCCNNLGAILDFRVTGSAQKLDESGSKINAVSDVGLDCEKGKEVSSGNLFADKCLKGITDLAHNNLGEGQLLDAMTTEHFWKSLVSVAAELLRNNDMGDHGSSRLAVTMLFPKSAYSVPNSAMSCRCPRNQYLLLPFFSLSSRPGQLKPMDRQAPWEAA